MTTSFNTDPRPAPPTQPQAGYSGEFVSNKPGVGTWLLVLAGFIIVWPGVIGAVFAGLSHNKANAAQMLWAAGDHQGALAKASVAKNLRIAAVAICGVVLLLLVVSIVAVTMLGTTAADKYSSVSSATGAMILASLWS